MLHSWVRVAAIVVSEMNDRLSPKKDPPTITATIIGVSRPVLWAMPSATGVSATIVPTEVPTASEMKQPARNSPPSNRFPGRMRSVRPTVASIAPVASADRANAPASTKIQIISIRLWCDAPCVKCRMRSASGSPREIRTE